MTNKIVATLLRWNTSPIALSAILVRLYATPTANKIAFVIGIAAFLIVMQFIVTINCLFLIGKQSISKKS